MNEATPPPLRDIAPPVDVFPYPTWMVVVAALVALLALGLIVWAVRRLLARRAPVPPPTPRETALRQLEELRPAIDTLDAQAFGDEVSAVLRTYLTRQFGLSATRQTSQEFLASLAGCGIFDDARKELLARFLEKCDLIKFARLEAGSAESAALLEQAFAFVVGETADVGTTLQGAPSAD